MKTLITVILVYIQIIMCAGFPSSSNEVPNAQNSEETVRDILQIIARTFPNSNNAQNAQMPVYNFQANRYIQNANYNELPNNQTNTMQVQGMNFYNTQTNQAPINAQIKEKTDLLDRLKNLANSITTLMMLNPAVTTPEQEELKELIKQTDQISQKVVIRLAEENLTRLQRMVSQQLAEAVMHSQQPVLFRERNMLPAMNALSDIPILPQPVVRPAQNTSAIQTPLINRRSIPANRTVRTISSTTPSQASSSRVPGINVPLAIQPNPVRTHHPYAPRDTRISEQFLRAWKTRTLNDENRDGFREQYNMVICSPDGDIEQNRNQQPGVENSIETLKKRIDACKPGQNIWEVVLKLLSFKGNKYKALHTIHENKEVFNTKLTQFVGYYDGFFKDLLAYVNEHGLLVYSKNNNTKILNKDVRKNTIADIYTKKSLDVPKMQECIKRCSADFKAFPLLNRIRTVLSMPEVYEDLSSIPDVLFQRIVASMEESKEISKKIEIVKSLHAIAHYPEDKLLSYQRVPFSDNLLQYFPNIANNKVTSPEYRVDKMYLEAYDAMVVFYKHAPYCYYNDNILQRVKGKDMVVKQEYKQCEALIDIAHNENGQIKPRLTSQKSSTVTDYCDASFEHPNHYHVQFVDNSYQAVRRVCVPFLSTNGRTYYVHTIEDIMKYLKDLYDIQEEGCIYALKTRIMQQRFSQHSWSFISEGDKKKTINDLSKEEYQVVFYHLQKGTLDNFTLSIFKRLHRDRRLVNMVSTFRVTPEIPLFLSPFMQCAMQLGPCEKIGHHRTLTEQDLQHSFIQPSVYVYSQPVDATPEMSFTQAENYYSTVYLDRDIFKTHNFCHTLKDSAIQESTTSHRLTWYIRMPKNPEEYTHYVFLDNQGDMFLKNKCTLYDMSYHIMHENEADNNMAYMFYGNEHLQPRKNTIIFDDNLKKIVNITAGYGSHIRMDNFYKLFVGKSFDISKSFLGIHNEIIRILLNTPPIQPE